MLLLVGEGYELIPCNAIRSAALIIVFSIGNALYLMWAQRTKERRRAELLAPYLVDPNVPSDGGEKAWVELGDRHPDFRYTL